MLVKSFWDKPINFTIAPVVQCDDTGVKDTIFDDDNNNDHK